MQPRTGAEPADPPSPAAAAGARRGRRLAAMVLGGIVLALLIYWAGAAQVLDDLRGLGWTAPLILLPYLAVNVLDTLGWRRTLPADVTQRIRFVDLYLARMAGEAVNSITPTAAVGGEPVKAHLLHRFGVSAADGVASVVIAKTALTLTQVAFILIGLGVLFERLGQRVVGALWLAGLAAVAIGFARLLVRLQRRGLATTLWKWLARIAPGARLVARLEPRVREIDARLADYYHVEREAFRAATLWHLGGWLLGVGEVWFIMWLIGEPVPLMEALIIESLAQPVRAAALVVPGGLGLQEVGGVALCTWLGIPRDPATTLWLLKRAREIVFDGIGVLYLTRFAGRGR
jgi:glycosyltransferase 2 family protein